MAHDILVVDDEEDIRTLISGILEDEGYTTRTAHDGLSALENIKLRQPSLVVLDVWLGDSDRDGLKILDLIKRDHVYVPVIMISGHGTIETAVSAIKKGAYDFIEKPFQTERLLLIIQRAIETSTLKRENDDLKKKAGTNLCFFGQTVAIQQLRQAIEKAGPTNGRIFLHGPSGSEKEAIAREIHAQSRRAGGPFIAFNCSTAHPQFVEADLFGAEISGLAPDQPRHIGAFEKAHTGTLFLDNIDELPLPIQGKVLRVLQDNTFQRMGSADKIDIDIRIIAASHKMTDAIASGNVREDLYYRLAAIQLTIPSLKERVTDLPALIKHLIEEQSTLHGVPTRKFSEEALAILQSHAWPGNIRQLKNVIDWILIHSDSQNREAISIEELPQDILNNNALMAVWNKSAEVVVLPLREARESFERDYLMAQVNRFGGNISQTARFIGMERSALHRKLRALGIYDEKDPSEVTKGAVG